MRRQRLSESLSTLLNGSYGSDAKYTLELVKRFNESNAEQMKITSLSENELRLVSISICDVDSRFSDFPAGAPLRIFSAGEGIFFPGGAVQVGKSVLEEFAFNGTTWRSCGVRHHLRDITSVIGIDERAEYVKLKGYTECRELDKPIFCFQGPWGAGNFGHFIHDYLVSLIHIDALKHVYGDDIYFGMPSPYFGKLRYPIMDWLFETLIGNLDKLVVINNNPVRSNSILFGDVAFSWLMDPIVVSEHAFKYLYMKMSGIMDRKFPSTRPGKRIYISRNDTVRSRRFDNILEIESFLSANNFEFVEVGRMGVDEILLTFRDADVIVGAHGAGLLNFLFSRADSCKVIELDTFPESWRSIKSVALAIGFEYSLVPATRSNQTHGYGVCDIDQLDRALNGGATFD